MKLVLLPGLDGTGVLFRPLLAALPPSIEPIVVSYPTREPLGYDELLPRARAMLPIDEPFVLLGESFGGPLSLRIAAEHPTGLKALILCGSFISCPFDFVPTWAAHGVHSLPFRAFPFLVELQSRLGLYATIEHESLAREAIAQVAPQVFAHRIREIICVNAERELRVCDVPMLYLQGKFDRVVPASNLARIKRIKQNIQVAQIPSSHMILKTRPVESIEAIASFIDSVAN